MTSVTIQFTNFKVIREPGQSMQDSVFLNNGVKIAEQLYLLSVLGRLKSLEFQGVCQSYTNG